MEVNNAHIAYYTVYVFKESGKWYTTESIQIDTQKVSCHQVAKEVKDRMWFEYRGMRKVLIPDAGNPNLYDIPIMVG